MIDEDAIRKTLKLRKEQHAMLAQNIVHFRKQGSSPNWLIHDQDFPEHFIGILGPSHIHGIFDKDSTIPGVE
jgi:hypothetical protein